jgi:hypothetical protein
LMAEKAVVCRTDRDKSATGTVNYPGSRATPNPRCQRGRGQGTSMLKRSYYPLHVCLLRIAMKVRFSTKPYRTERSVHVG